MNDRCITPLESTGENQSLSQKTKAQHPMKQAQPDILSVTMGTETWSPTD